LKESNQKTQKMKNGYLFCSLVLMIYLLFLENAADVFTSNNLFRFIVGRAFFKCVIFD
jgi:hypothetical protein